MLCNRIHVWEYVQCIYRFVFIYTYRNHTNWWSEFLRFQKCRELQAYAKPQQIKGCVVKTTTIIIIINDIIIIISYIIIMSISSSWHHHQYWELFQAFLLFLHSKWKYCMIILIEIFFFLNILFLKTPNFDKIIKLCRNSKRHKVYICWEHNVTSMQQ